MFMHSARNCEKTWVVARMLIALQFTQRKMYNMKCFDA